jgi:DNA-binding transcriptional ArsR family regulator
VTASSTTLKVPLSDDQLDRIFHALSDRTRREVLRRLASGPAKVSELAAPFRMSRMAVSKHVQVLERARLIAREVDGRVHHCSLATAPLLGVDQWLTFYRAFWTGNLDAFAGYLEHGAHTPRRPATKRRRSHAQ